jgi:hypothetical protein
MKTNLAFGTIPWAERWIGGMCPAGVVGGLAVRGPDYAVHPPLERVLPLPRDLAHAPVSLDIAHEAWASICESPVLLLRSVQHARQLLLRALDVRPGETVGLAANADRELTEVVKHHGAIPRFLALDSQLAVCADAPDRPRIVVAQPAGGLGVCSSAATWLDCAETIPQPGSTATGAPATVYGLHLHADPNRAGALIVFADADLADHCAALLTADAHPEPTSALIQARRLAGSNGLASQQRAALTEVWRGLDAAAGLPLLPLAEAGPLPLGVAVQIPPGSDVATFYAYVRAERTPVRWLPEVRPLHYAALREPGAHQASAETLARWLLVPVGPSYTDEEIRHAVLGIVKTADYLGVRWFTDPRRAHEYAGWMDELYGAGHDAYRVLFRSEESHLHQGSR